MNPDKSNNTGTSGWRFLQPDERDCIGRLVSSASTYDPFRGSSREYVWVDDANCASVDPELFQVSQKGDPEVAGMNLHEVTIYNREKLARAVAVCEDCPVKQRCLDESTKSDRVWSVRGGELPKKFGMKRGAHIPSWDIEGYDEPWTCRVHGKVFKRVVRRENRAAQVYCNACRAGVNPDPWSVGSIHA